MEYEIINIEINSNYCLYGEKTAPALTFGIKIGEDIHKTLEWINYNNEKDCWEIERIDSHLRINDEIIQKYKIDLDEIYNLLDGFLNKFLIRNYKDN